MPSIVEDATITALRDACDRHAGIGKLADGFPAALVCEIADCLPTAIFQCVVSPLDRSGRQSVSLRIDPAFDNYMEFVINYWQRLLQKRQARGGYLSVGWLEPRL